MYINSYVYICIYVCVCVRACVRVRTYVHIHIYYLYVCVHDLHGIEIVARAMKGDVVKTMARA